MELKEGMYVRTEIGSIGKITKITNENIFFDRQVYRNRWYSNSNTKFLRKEVAKIYIKKISNNIIDLIEVGDYVNGLLVQSNDYNFDKPIKIFSYLRFGKEDIKSIVTKEQFESMSYKVN